jgi:hypothetical protein
MALSLIHTLYSSLEYALSLFSPLFLHRRLPGNGSKAVNSSASVFHDFCPRWLTPTLQITRRMSKLYYDRRSVGQSILVSSRVRFRVRVRVVSRLAVYCQSLRLGSKPFFQLNPCGLILHVYPL